MKRKVGVFFYLLVLLSACGVPVATEPIPQAQHSPIPTLAIDSTPSPRPTSTRDPLYPEASGGFPFCQVAPQKPRLGSPVNIAAFRLPANHPVSIFIYDDNRTIQALPNTILTDGNGYVNVDIVIPEDLSTETWNRIALIAEGRQVEASCGIWPWAEVSLATWSDWQTKVRVPTLTVPPEQAAMTATQQVLKDSLGANCTYGSAQAIRPSPNGQWGEVICGPDSVIIIQMDGTKEWKLSSDSLIAPYTDDFINVFHWSSDGVYAYVKANPHTDGYWEPFHHAAALFRLNLETGQVSEVLRGDYYSFAFSPNDRRLAYIVTDRSPVILKIRDMQTGVEQSIAFDSKYNTGGAFAWSPDSQKVLFSITQFDTSTYEYVATSVVLYDHKKRRTTVLLQDDKQILIPVEWLGDTRILLQVLFEDETKYELDMITNEIRPIRP